MNRSMMAKQLKAKRMAMREMCDNENDKVAIDYLNGRCATVQSGKWRPVQPFSPRTVGEEWAMGYVRRFINGM